MPGQVETAATAAAEAKDVARSKVATMRQTIERSSDEFARALPDHVKPDRFIRAALTAVNVVPKLAECTTRSVVAGLMQAAQLGLEVADVRGQCYLIPRRDGRTGEMRASFQLGYRGMIDLAARSGITVEAEEIHERDAFDFQLGTRRYLTHRPNFGARGPAIAYYAVASFADRRDPTFAIMGRGEIEEHRDRFASTRNAKGEIVGPWVEHFDAMARKTVIRALLNYLPVAVELREAMHADAIETTATEQPTRIDYGGGFELPPEEIDATNGDVDPTDPNVVDVEPVEPVPAPVEPQGAEQPTSRKPREPKSE